MPEATHRAATLPVSLADLDLLSSVEGDRKDETRVKRSLARMGVRGGRRDGSRTPDEPGTPPEDVAAPVAEETTGTPAGPRHSARPPQRPATGSAVPPDSWRDLLTSLAGALRDLPGVTPRGADRIALHLLRADDDDVHRLVAAIVEAKARIGFCELCGNFADEALCGICSDPRRSQSVICVVEEVSDIAAIERTGEFRGRYHVLGGAINPIAGIGPDDLRIPQLLARLADGKVTEVILATDPNVEGEATATYLARCVLPMGLAVSRLASGSPFGGDLRDLELDALARAIDERRPISA